MSSRFKFGLLAGVAVVVTGAFVTLTLVTDIFVRPVTGPIKPAAELHGRVVFNEQPADGAQVRIAGHPEFATSDAGGRFSLAGSGQPASVAAWKDGFFIASARTDEAPLSLSLRKLPESDHEGYSWRSPTPERMLLAGSELCGTCHRAIFVEWVRSGHGVSAVRQHFRNLYEGTDAKGRADVGWNLARENPDGIGVCAACHAPTLEPSAQKNYDMRSVFKDHNEFVPGLSGVHCDYCHKITGPAGGAIGLTHGRFGLKLLRPAEGQLLFGPLKDSTRNDNAFSSFQKDSRYCASCHEGTVFGVPVYTTYSEWQASPAGKAGKQCQECHMKPTGRISNLAPGFGGIERDPTTLSNHRFFEGSGAEMLHKCMRVGVRATRQDGSVRVVLETKVDDVGHRVPTGFADRNVVITIVAVDAEGKELTALAGPKLPPVAGKNVSGKPGRLYAKILKDFQGRTPVPFWRAAPEFTDTRLVPGEADVADWLFPPTARFFTIRVVHRRFWPDVADQKGWPDNESLIGEWEEPVPAP